LPKISSSMMKIFNGRTFALEKEQRLARRIAGFKAKTGISPKLMSIVVGDSPASLLYVRFKQESAKRVGIEFEKVKFAPDVQAEEIIRRIKQENYDQKTHGIMVQLPLPKRYVIGDTREGILDVISSEKDVDCLTTENFKLLESGTPRFLPATVKAILEVIRETRYEIRGANICVVGASLIVGKPLTIVLRQMGARVTVCRSKTIDLPGKTKKADILISATGVPSLIKPEMIKTGAVVIDVGSPRGDVDSLVVNRASFFTPVPGGVGPVTIACLMENVLQASLSSDRISKDGKKE